MVGAGIILFFGAEFFVSQFTDNSEAIKHGAIYLKGCSINWSYLSCILYYNSSISSSKKTYI